MDLTEQKTVSQDDDPLACWRVSAGNALTLGAPGAATVVIFERSSYQLALPMSSLDYGILDTNATRHQGHTEELKLVFGSHVVTLWGERLSELLKAIAERSVVLVREAPPSASLLESKAVVVKEMKWAEVHKARTGEA